MGGAQRGLLVAVTVLVAFACTATAARAAGYATDDSGRLYRVVPRRQTVELLGTVRVPVERDGGTVWLTPTLTDIALHDEHGLYGISFTDLYKIDLRDPGHSKHVGSLGTGILGRFNALEFDDEGRLWAAAGNALYRVDRASGRARKVGDFGLSGSSSGDLAWADGALYVTLDGSGGCMLAKLDTAKGKATRVGWIRSKAKRALLDVWGLIWDGRSLWGLTPGGEIAEIDRETATVEAPFRAGVRFWGACPRVRM